MRQNDNKIKIKTIAKKLDEKEYFKFDISKEITKGFVKTKLIIIKRNISCIENKTNLYITII